MKILHIVLTVLFWILVAYCICSIPFIMRQNPKPNDSSYTVGFFFGTIIGTAVFPGIVFLARYYVGKSIKKAKQQNELQQADETQV